MNDQVKKGIVLGLVLLPIILYLGFSHWRIISLPDPVRVQYTPDDGYYYLTLARHFAHSFSWTFDGVNPTSGFHPLWAYLLAVVYWPIRSLSIDFVTAAMVLGSILTAITVGLIGLDNRKRKDWIFRLLAGLALVTSPWFRCNSISLTEWPLALLCSYLFFRYWHDGSFRLKPIFLLAFLGTLARTEFVVLIYSLSLASLLLQRDLRLYQVIKAGTLGAITGLALTTGHSWLIAGTLLQSSAAMKLYWADHFRTGTEYESVLTLLSRCLGFEGMAIPQMERICLALVLIAIFAAVVHQQTRLKLVGALLTLLIYAVFYYETGSVQMWYTGLIVVPLFFVFSDSAIALSQKLGGLVRAASIVGLLLLIFHNTSSISDWASPYPHQRAMYEAGMYIKRANLKNVASWNAGIIGYYAGGSVTNLDGLVNSNIHPYIENHNLRGYVEQHQIAYIADFQNVLKDYYQLRGGYDDGEFLASLIPLRTFPPTGQSWDGMTIWKYERQ